MNDLSTDDHQFLPSMPSIVTGYWLACARSTETSGYKSLAERLGRRARIKDRWLLWFGSAQALAATTNPQSLIGRLLPRIAGRCLPSQKLAVMKLFRFGLVVGVVSFGSGGGE